MTKIFDGPGGIHQAPYYMCASEECEKGHLAKDLKVHEGGTWCADCWDNAEMVNEVGVYHHDLEDFIPENVANPHHVPHEWKLVPKFATEEMVQNAWKFHEGEPILPYSFYMAMIEAAPEPKLNNGWQPIDTAPRCGKPIRVGWWDGDGMWNEMVDFDYEGLWHNHQDHFDHYSNVRAPGMVGPKETAPYTHWMPIPEPPAR